MLVILCVCSVQFVLQDPSRCIARFGDPETVYTVCKCWCSRVDICVLKEVEVLSQLTSPASLRSDRVTSSSPRKLQPVSVLVLGPFSLWGYTLPAFIAFMLPPTTFPTTFLRGEQASGKWVSFKTRTYIIACVVRLGQVFFIYKFGGLLYRIWL